MNAETERGITDLSFANRHRNVNVLSELLNHEKIDANVKDKKWQTTLMDACYHGRLDAVRTLLNHNKVDLDAKDLKGRTAFYIASHGCHWDIVKALSCRDIDVNVRGPLGCTALFWATVSGELDVVFMLLKLDSVNANVKNKAGSTALYVARNSQMRVIAKCLEEHTKSC